MTKVHCPRYDLVEPDCFRCFDRECNGRWLHINFDLNPATDYYKKIEARFMEACKP